MTFPPPPTEAIDWNDVGFRVREVNGHIESHYSVATGVWSAPKFISSPYLSIHGMAPGLNYGQQAYEGIKAFRTPDNRIAIFRPAMNAVRMAHSAAVISIPPVPAAHFLACVRQAVARNAAFVPPHASGAALYVRPLLFGSSAQLGLSPPDEYTFCVFVLPTGVYHGSAPIAALVLEDFDRAAPEGTGSAKVGGNYAPVLRWSGRAKAEGYGITLHLDSKTRTEVDEFSTSGFIGVRKEGDEYTVVIPDSRSAIESVTSDSARQIAASMGMKVEKRMVRYEELASFSEVIAAGTAAALVPVKSITRRSTNDTFHYLGQDGHVPPICEKLLTRLQGIQRGTEEDIFGWRDYVDAPEDLVAEKTSGIHINGA